MEYYSNFTDSLNNHTTEDKRSKYQNIIAALFLLLTILLALLGNTAVIAVVCIQRSMRRETSNMLIVNLCITDLSNTVFVMSSAFLAIVYDDWYLGSVWCDCVCAINYCLIIVSMLTMCCISLDRYQAIMYPLSYRIRVKRRHMVLVIIYTWVQGITFGLAPSVSGWVAFDYWEGICAIQWHLYHPDSVIYVVLAFLLCFLIPGIILIHCYIKILKEVKNQKYLVKINVSGDSKTIEQNKKKVSTRSKIVWSLLVVVLAYFVCTTPFSVTKLIKVVVEDKNFIPGPINLLASLLGYVASAINPLIYGIFRRDFRIAYKHLLCTVILGRKYPGITDHTNSASMVRTITNTNYPTNHDLNNITGLESALNELEISRHNSHVTDIDKSQRSVRFQHSTNGTANRDSAKSSIDSNHKVTIPTTENHVDKIRNNETEETEQHTTEKHNNDFKDDTNQNIAKSSTLNRGSCTLSSVSCKQIIVKSVTGSEE